ncbi:hypothetical protein Syun_018995 [Stephania yunnanensis]|uniref:Uncharacterized protein n=1 Tax=Stephania yunnanensis TaxID=152371 RepID=A0AAP0IT99_9MAGN
MADAEFQKDLLCILRDVAAEKHEGERRVANLKKRVEELRSELESANSAKEKVKHAKEVAEQELRRSQVELALSEASIKSLEKRISEYQGQLAKIGSEIGVLKYEENAERDEFIREMLELRERIRNSQKPVNQTVGEDKITKVSTDDDGTKVEGELAAIDPQTIVMDMKDKLKHLVSQTDEAQCEYQEKMKFYNEVQQKLLNLKRRNSLLNEMVKVMKELQELTRQTTELEETCTSLSEELQKQCACPTCHLVNVGSLGGILQDNDSGSGVSDAQM